jgi:hypothetical protein
MTIDVTIVSAILAVIGGGVVTAVTQAFKKWLGIEGGWKAMALAGLLSVAATAYILATLHVFTVAALIPYALVVFGEATGLYHLTGKTA